MNPIAEPTREFFVTGLGGAGGSIWLGKFDIAGWGIPQTADSSSQLGYWLGFNPIKPLEKVHVIGVLEDRVYLLEKAEPKKRDCCGKEWFVLQWRRADASRDEPKPTYIFNAGDEF